MLDYSLEPPDVHSSSAGYAKRFAGEIGLWFLALQADLFVRFAGEGGGRSLLDVGGGHAQIVGPACQAGFAVTVLGSAECCSELLQPLLQNGSCEFKVGDMLNLPFADREFELVTCFRQLSHLQDWQRLVAELCRVARHAVIIDYPPLRSANILARPLFLLKKMVEGNARKFKVFSDQEICAAFENSGFRLVNRSGQLVLPMVVHRWLRMPKLSALVEAGLVKVGLLDLFGSPVVVKMVRQD